MKISELAKDVKDSDEAYDELKNEMGITLITMSQSRYPLTCAHIWVNLVFAEEDFTTQYKIIRILLGAAAEMNRMEARVIEDIANDVIFNIFDC